MTHNFNVKITTGKKTDISVATYCTAYAEKRVDFKNSRKFVTNKNLSRALSAAIHNWLAEWQNKQTN